MKLDARNIFSILANFPLHSKPEVLIKYISRARKKENT